MKKLLRFVFAILFVLLFHGTAKAISIDDVNVIPIQPLQTDIITFDIFGIAGSPSWVEYDQFSQDGISLLLDLHFDMGMLPVVSDWSYSRQIGALAPATYTLTVRAFAPDKIPWNGALQDTYTTEFTVTPEPASVFLLGLGVLVIRRKKTQE